MTERTKARARLGAFALALTIALSAMGAAAAVIAARTPDASDIPQIATGRPLATPLLAPSTAEESTATPTDSVEATAPPTPADRYVPRVGSGNLGTGDLGSEGDDDADRATDSESDEDDEREVITPPVREDDDSEDDSDGGGSETDENRESLPDTDDSPEEG